MIISEDEIREDSVKAPLVIGMIQLMFLIGGIILYESQNGNLKEFLWIVFPGIYLSVGFFIYLLSLTIYYTKHEKARVFRQISESAYNWGIVYAAAFTIIFWAIVASYELEKLFNDALFVVAGLIMLILITGIKAYLDAQKETTST